MHVKASKIARIITPSAYIHGLPKLDLMVHIMSLHADTKL